MSNESTRDAVSVAFGDGDVVAAVEVEEKHCGWTGDVTALCG